jgi:hypothetical protein
MQPSEFDKLVNTMLVHHESSTLYYPTVHATRGPSMGMTQVDVSKTFPATDKTAILKFPKDVIRKRKKVKQSPAA